MKRTYQITALTALALAFVAIGRHHAGAPDHPLFAPVTMTETVTGGPSPTQAMDLSERGLAAVNHLHLARIAINDGDVDKARTLLGSARELLSQVKAEDRPVTVTTDFKVGGKAVQHGKQRETLNLIPILSEFQVVETFGAAPPATADASATSAQDQTAVGTPPTTPDQRPDQGKGAAQAQTERTSAKDQAIAKAQEHLRQGDPKAAADDLKLADLMLISKVISMPLTETSAHVDQALRLLKQGLLHEANLELKTIQDGLVLRATVVNEPVAAAPSPEAPAAAG